MPPVPLLKPRQVMRAFEKLGWEVSRRESSHIVAVPDHPQVARGTLRSLIAKAGLTVEEFVEAVEK
jgi:predicted RNA binding protein YcfA (HicA-like mRNA interferase family)